MPALNPIAELMRDVAYDVAADYSILNSAVLSAIQHLEHGRPSHALRDLTEAVKSAGCMYCGAKSGEAKPFIIPGKSCVRCGAA